MHNKVEKLVLAGVGAILVVNLIVFLVLNNKRPDYSIPEQEESEVSTSRILGSEPNCNWLLGPNGMVCVPVITTASPSPSPTTYISPTPTVSPTPTASVSPTSTPASTLVSKPVSTPTVTPTPTLTPKATPSPSTTIAPTPEPALPDASESTPVIEAQNQVENNQLGNMDDFFAESAESYRTIVSQDSTKKPLAKIDQKTGDYLDQTIYSNPFMVSALIGSEKALIANMEDYQEACISNSLTKEGCSGFTYASADENECSVENALSNDDFTDNYLWLQNRVGDLEDRLDSAALLNPNWYEEPQSTASSEGNILNLDARPAYNSSDYYQIDNPRNLTKAELKKNLEEAESGLLEINQFLSTSPEPLIYDDTLSENSSTDVLSSSKSLAAVEASDSKKGDLTQKYPTVSAITKKKNALEYQKKINKQEADYRNSIAGRVVEMQLMPSKALLGVKDLIGSFFTNIKNKFSGKNGVCSKNKAKANKKVRVPLVDAKKAAETFAQFDKTEIVPDAFFSDKGMLSVSEIEKYLKKVNSPLLDVKPADFGVDPLTGLEETRGIAQLIYDYANYSGEITVKKEVDGKMVDVKKMVNFSLNPVMILALLQKEQGVVKGLEINDDYYRRLGRATSFGCPDDSPCDPKFSGLSYQVYMLSKTSTSRFQLLKSGNTFEGTKQPISVKGKLIVSGQTITVKNAATGVLYIYNPHEIAHKQMYSVIKQILKDITS